jgi:outer membrane protein assembly factor BamB
LVLSGFFPLAGVGSAAAANASAEPNWPQWRGPLATGFAPAANPPVTWSEQSNVKWKVKLPGSGTATPIIWGNQVFIQTAIATDRKVDAPVGKPGPVPAALPVPAPAEPPAQNRPEGGPGRRRGGGGGMGSNTPTESYQFALLCLDRQSGKTVWQKTAREEVPHEGHHQDHGFSSHSPLTDGQSVFAYFGSRGLHCYDLRGNLKWSRDFGRMKTKNSFGEGSSPALSGNTIVINWDHEGEDFIMALDKRTGKELWRQSRDEETTWSTPLIVEHDGRTEIITSATKKIRSYDLATGKELWECGGMTANVIPTPVAADGIVYPISGFRGSALLAIRLGRSGDLTGTDAIAWQHSKSTPYVPSPLLYGGRLYFLGGNNGILSCFDAKSGQVLINAERLESLSGVYASPVGAGGRIYLVGRNGAAMVIKQSDKLEVLATNRLEEKFDASPAVAGRELFLRGHEYLYCLAEK